MVTVAALFLSGTFFTLFDRAPGTDGGLCNNRQLQHALDELRDTAGYRYVDTEQHQVLLSDPSTSLEDPVFGWADTLSSTVAYLAPDRTHQVVTSLDPDRSRGYTEQLRIGNEQWQLRHMDGQSTWVRDAPWPTGNWAWGYVQNAMGLLGMPGIAALQFGAEPVPDGLSGAGGCTIAAPGESENRIVALRVGADGRVSDIYLGPPAGAPGNRDAYRNLIALTYELPDAAQFVAPADFEEGDVEPHVSIGPLPTTGPLRPPEGAWEAVPFPVPSGERVTANVTEIVPAGDRWVAIGSSQSSDNSIQALAWTSADGVAWELVDSPPGFSGIAFLDLAWNGETFLAVGYRSHEASEDALSVDLRESWLSTDGVTWVPGGTFEPGSDPGRPVATEHGWVAGGSVWSGEIQRPAFFSSVDGITWVTHQPAEGAYGSVGRPVVNEDGTIRATSCETPEETNTAGGSPCFVREWTSTDGLTWTPGPATEDTDAGLEPVAATDAFLAIRYDTETGEPELVRSADGSSWEPIDGPDAPIWPAQLTAIPDGVVLIGQVNDVVTSTVARAWRSTDGGERWDEIPLDVLPEAIGRYVDRVVPTDDGLRLYGWMEFASGATTPVAWVEP